MDRQELTEKFFSLKEIKDEKSKELKAINEELELIEQALIAAMENDSLDLFRDQRYGYTVFLEADMKASIEDEEAAFNSLRLCGHGDVIKAQVNPRTLTALVKEMAANGQEIEGIKKYEFTKVRFRRNGK